MRSVCFIAMLAVLGVLWQVRHPVIAAYTDERPPVDLRLAAGDFSLDRSTLDPSPFVLHITRPELRMVEVAGIVASSDAVPDVAVVGGTAELMGAVMGPDGPVEGAVVRIERHTSTDSAVTEVVSAADGSWRAGGLLGGRYRVRAFVPNQLAQVDPQVFFLEEGQQRSVNPTLVAPSAEPSVTFHPSGPHYLGLSAVGAVVMGKEIVDSEGRLVVVPAGGRSMTLVVSGAAALVSPAVVVTAGDGSARLSVMCRALGAAELRVTTSIEAGEAWSQPMHTFALPPCVEIPSVGSDPSTTPGTSTTTDPGSVGQERPGG